jgi:anthranilate phosphoribosyltransferase
VNYLDPEELIGAMLDGLISDGETKYRLLDIAARGETTEELVGAAKAMRARMIQVEAPGNAIDVCGTGGDGQHSLNVSTAVAIVVAACGVPVAKHGNRAASSKAGGADTLQALGLNLNHASDREEEALKDIGIAFLFAQNYHPALAAVAHIRKEIGERTVFNLLGPLCNPAGVTRQLVGVPNPDLIARYVDAMSQLGTARAMVVSGDEGLDEISISGSTEVATIGFGLPSPSVVPEDAGLPRYPPEAIKGGDAAYNAAALRRLLMGEGGAYRDAVLINAAGALIVADRVSSWKDGVEEAAEAIDRGLAKALLDCWIAYR